MKDINKIQQEILITKIEIQLIEDAIKDREDKIKRIEKETDHIIDNEYIGGREQYEADMKIPKEEQIKLQKMAEFTINFYTKLFK